MMNTKIDKSIVCYGEILFDIFPSYKKIGGAPLNVAIRLASLGNSSSIISKVGTDDLGNELVDYLKKNNVNTTLIQFDNELDTGQVTVTLDKNGSASYTINYPAAWDKIEVTKENHKIISSADVFLFGSLICRDKIAHDTLFKLIEVARLRIFDVNLRKPFYTINTLNKLMLVADFIKFNEEEILEICELNGMSNSTLEECIIHIAEQTYTPHICVTKGSKGAVLYTNGQFYNHAGYPIKVADTVGAGDSFLAGLLHKLLQKSQPEDALDFACALGALVAGEYGANPIISISDIDQFIDKNTQNE